MSVRFNFFGEKEEILNSVCEYFGLKQDEVISYVDEQGADNLTGDAIIGHFKLNLAKYDSSTAEVVGRHITTTDDNGIKEYGTMSIKWTLQTEIF